MLKHLTKETKKERHKGDGSETLAQNESFTNRVWDLPPLKNPSPRKEAHLSGKRGKATLRLEKRTTVRGIFENFSVSKGSKNKDQRGNVK